MRRLKAFLATLTLTGCQAQPIQSALHPAGTAAERIAVLWWVMLGVLGAITLVVFALLFFGLYRRSARPPGGNTPFIVVGGIAVPALVLVALLVMSLDATVALRRPAADVAIEVVGHQFWWEVRYPALDIVTANEITLPAGRPVHLQLLASDVLHSFWVPNLMGKRDMMPDHPLEFWLPAAQAGTYRGQCAEFCGIQHAHMAFTVEVLPEEAFQAWVAARREAPAAPEAAEPARGRAVFAENGCGTCHAVRGTGADGLVGPDLTHMGARSTIGAGMLPNTVENLQAWIKAPQAIKPGNLMPNFDSIPPEDLRALALYLESLK